MSDDISGKVSRRRVTLDGQLVSYWEREARRLEAQARSARWNWVARSLRRRAERARAKGAQFAERERARTPLADGPASGPA